MKKTWSPSRCPHELAVLLPDVNVLIYAHRPESPEHERYAEWLQRLASGVEPFGFSELAASGFVRIVTNSKVWRTPTPLPKALLFLAQLRERSNARSLTHGPESWAIFKQIALAANARGKLLADAYHAALAIEHGCEFATADADFSRFKGLRVVHPLA